MSELLTVSDLEIAKKHDTFHSEVITGKVGGLATGANIDTATNKVTGQTQKTLPKQLYDENAIHDAQILAHETEFKQRISQMAFVRVGTFEAGYSALTDMRQTLLASNGHEYGWSGDFPKIVPFGSTPETTGGVGAGAWVDRTDVTLRSELALNYSTVLVGGKSAKDLAHKNGAVDNVFDVAPAISPSNAVQKAQLDGAVAAHSKRELLIAHRGFGYRGIYPENTMAAFVSAEKDGANAIETDISITSDGYRVLLHDSTVDRTSNGAGTITNLTFAYVRGLDFGGDFNAIYAGERIPEFSELLSFCYMKNLECWPEIKNIRTTADIDLIISDILAAGMQNNTVVICFNLSHLQYFRTINSDIKVGFLTSTVPTSGQYNDLQSLGNAYLLPQYLIVNETMVAECKARGLDIAVWTVDWSSVKKKMELLGVTKVISNYNLGGK